MKPTNAATTLLAWLCLLISTPLALAQSGPRGVGLVPDSTSLRRAVAGQSFPFAQGVSMELALYRQVRLAGVLADTTITSKNRRIDLLGAQLATSQALYSNCTGALTEERAAADRQAAALVRLPALYNQLNRAKARARWNPLTPACLLALLAGVGAGLYIAP